jgi:hypothetical protein
LVLRRQQGQIVISRIKAGQGLPGDNGLPDFYHPGRHLATVAKSQFGFMPRMHDARERALNAAADVVGRHHQDRMRLWLWQRFFPAG